MNPVILLAILGVLALLAFYVAFKIGRFVAKLVLGFIGLALIAGAVAYFVMRSH